MDRSFWTDRIASFLEDLGSEEFQQRSWIRGEGDEVSSFEEAVCALSDFDLVGFAERCTAWGYPPGFSEDLLAFDRDLGDYARRIRPGTRHEAILADPMWSALRARAKVLANVVRAGGDRRT